tara:strand:+ start:50 stop:418 length:369 start_codon:yes stop_codon:yes gene_type:complete
MKIGEIFRGAVSSAAGWAGGLIGGAVGGTKGALIGKELGSKVGGLFERKAGDDSGFEPISTIVQPASFGGRMGFFKPGRNKLNVGMAKTENAETMNALWDARLLRYYTSAYKIKRTVTSLKA